MTGPLAGTNGSKSMMVHAYSGQCFHYLTWWMHALDQVARSTPPLATSLFPKGFLIVQTMD